MIEEASFWGVGVVTVLSGVTAILSFLFCNYLSRINFLPDRVTERSNHTARTSRAGGLVFFFSYTIGLVILICIDSKLLQEPLLHLIIFSLSMAVIGFIDDKVSLQPAYKFLGQFIIAAGLVISCGGIDVAPIPFIGMVELGWFGYGIAIFWIVSFVNVFNFMDGLDGMAAGTSIIAGLAISLAAVFSEAVGLFAVSFLLAGALMGFMLVNFRKGSIFMGDCGSLGLGFFFAGLAVLVSQDGPIMSTSPIGFTFIPMIFLPFILDVIRTLMMRARAGEKLYEAHKQHIYQQMAASGRSHQQVSSLYMALALLCALAALANMQLEPALQWIGPMVMSGLLVLIGGVRFVKKN